MSRFNFLGSMVALVTPMTNTGEVDYQDLDNLVDFHLANNTDGLVVLGTTGEAATLTSAEKEKIVKQVLQKVSGKIPVIVGTGHNCTDTAIELTKQAEQWGADAALVVTPYYNKPSQAGLIAHYKAIASAVALPILLYNVPGRTACDMLPDTTAELAKVKNIVGLKEAVENPDRINALVANCPKDFALLSGDDETIINFLKSGGHGVISVTCNIVPDRINAIINAGKNNDWSRAEATNDNLVTLHKKLFISANPVPIKWALFYTGLIKTPNCRLPLLPLEDKFHGELITALQLANVTKLSKIAN